MSPSTGRLVTLDGFALNGDSNLGFPHLDANFSVTTYLVPPSQGVTAGASPTAPGDPDGLEPRPPPRPSPTRDEPAQGAQRSSSPSVKAPISSVDL